MTNTIEPQAWRRVSNISNQPRGVFETKDNVELRSEQLEPLFNISSLELILKEQVELMLDNFGVKDAAARQVYVDAALVKLHLNLGLLKNARAAIRKEGSDS